MNLNFDNPTVEENAEQQAMADEIYFDDLFTKMSDEHIMQERIGKYERFLEAVHNSGINVERIYDNPLTKIEHLKIMGYTGLRGKGKNKHVEFKDAKAVRIGRAYLKTYNTARKACDAYFNY